MLQKGASQPWQQTMKELTGGEKMDASAILDYFAPLQAWLKQQNEGQTCGWQASGTTAAGAGETCRGRAQAGLTRTQARQRRPAQAGLLLCGACSYAADRAILGA